MKIREKISNTFLAIGALLGYLSLFISAGGNDRLGCFSLIGMIISIIIGFLLSDYFLDSFRRN